MIMIKNIFFVVTFLSFCFALHGQKYLTQTGKISFFSATPVENIEAYNNQVSSVINMETGEMAFTLLMKAFSFEKALMQEHFNEKYVESDKFPKSNFKGKITNFNEMTFKANGPDAHISGQLTIHGVTKQVEVSGKLVKKDNGTINGLSVFNILIEDYDIKIPAPVRDNIAKTIEITVNLDYEKMD
jgi:hypothetical protein